MEGLILVMLPAQLLFLFAVCVLAFFDVAFARQDAMPREGAQQRRLPLVSGVSHPRPLVSKKDIRGYSRPWIPPRYETRVRQGHVGRRAHT
jgi:hypothetical protein